MRYSRFLLGLLTLVAVGVLGSTVLAQDKSDLPTVPADNPFAAFIDSHNVAIAKGATAEWRKMEGVAMDPVNKKVYIAVTEIGKGMADDKGDIQLKANKCGAVYAGDLDADFNVSNLKAVVVGGPYDESNKDYPCNPDAISNPDNVFVDAKGNLWIGEDTDYHKNQMLWMWNGKELKRFATQPNGAEVTGLRVEPNGTLFLNVQHPDVMNPYPFNRGLIGIVTGYKAGDDFKSLPIPTGDDTKKTTLAAGEYQILARVGDPIPGAFDKSVVGAITRPDGGLIHVCNNPDGNMFLPTTDTYTEGYLYTNVECLPGGVNQLYIKQGADGKWNTIEGGRVDFTPVGGTGNNCNGSVTPWNTALTSEEYPPDVQGEWDGYKPFMPLIEANTGAKANPFNTGYIVELKPAGGEDEAIGTSAVKHYAMGRFSKEMALIMPDNKTAYFGDDGTDRVLYKFVADNASDLSAGTLYAAKIKQDGETLNLNWVELGKGKDDDIKAAVEALAPKS